MSGGMSRKRDGIWGLGWRSGELAIRVCASGWKPTSKKPLTSYRMSQAHHRHIKSTNMLERLNEELKRRTLVVRIFPNVGSCLRLIRALAVEIHEDWIEATRYLNM